MTRDQNNIWLNLYEAARVCITISVIYVLHQSYIKGGAYFVPSCKYGNNPIDNMQANNSAQEEYEDDNFLYYQ